MLILQEAIDTFAILRRIGARRQPRLLGAAVLSRKIEPVEFGSVGIFATVVVKEE
jgi:hypothetical protein